MRISDEDRSLAHELAAVFDLNVRDEGALRVILSSHRQLPSDEKASGIQVPPCNAVHPDSSGDVPVRCVMLRAHHGDHQAAGIWWAQS